MLIHRCVLMLCLGLGVCLPALGEKIIIESQPEGQNNDHYREILGKWITSHNPTHSTKSRAPGLTDKEKCGSRKLLFQPTQKNAGATTAPAFVRFMPKLNKSGHYYVYATWPEGSNAQPVYYNIRHAKGMTSIPIVQTGQGGSVPSNANQWVALGEYDFNPGEDQYVELRVEMDTKPVHDVWSGQVYSDSVMFSTTPEGSAVKQNQSDRPGASSGASSVLVAPASGKPAAEVAWMDDIQQAMAAATQSNRRILLYFHSPLTTTCQYYATDVFTNPQVKALLSTTYIPVRVDFASQTEMAAKLNVFKAGTICVFDSHGAAISQITGRVTASELLDKLR